MPRRDALVAEDPADLEHALHAAHDQPLVVQLERDPQIEVHVERVVMRDERPGMGATRFEMQHRRLDLDEAFVVQCASEAGDDGVADLEVAARLLVDDQVGVTLTKSCVDIGQAVPFVGQRAHGLRQQLHGGRLDRQLALAGGHHRAVHTDPVAEIERFHVVELIVTRDRLRDEQLDLIGTILNRGKHQLAGVALEHHPTGDGDLMVGFRARFEVAPGLSDLAECVRTIEPIRIRFVAPVSQFPDACEASCLLRDEATSARLVQFVGVLGRRAHDHQTVAADHRRDTL